MAPRMAKDTLDQTIDAASLDAVQALDDRQQVMLTATRDH